MFNDLFNAAIGKPYDVFHDRPIILVALGLDLQITQGNVTDLPFLFSFHENASHFVSAVE